MKPGKTELGRLLIYLLGIVLVSLGIVLCKKSNLGISPVSSIPYVLECVVPLSFGTLTMLFHVVNTLSQMALLGKIRDIRLLLQFPLAFAFGWVIDGIQAWVIFDGTVLFYQAAALFFSIFFTAAGMVCMIRMDLVQNPPDGLVRQLSRVLGQELGKVKIGYDVCCVAISIFLGFLCLGTMKGFGIATILSAVFVGKMVSWIQHAVELWKQEWPEKQPVSAKE